MRIQKNTCGLRCHLNSWFCFHLYLIPIKVIISNCLCLILIFIFDSLSFSDSCFFFSTSSNLILQALVLTFSSFHQYPCFILLYKIALNLFSTFPNSFDSTFLNCTLRKHLILSRSDCPSYHNRYQISLILILCQMHYDRNHYSKVLSKKSFLNSHNVITRNSKKREGSRIADANVDQSDVAS